MLSVCMMVRNEERCLQRCLDSVKLIAGELIIVDTGSTDSTPEICRANGAQVIPFDFSIIDFGTARNAGLAKASGDWILVLDADEALEAHCVPTVAELVGGNVSCGYYVERFNKDSNGAVSNVDYVVRLFRNRPEHRYRHRVHETIDESIRAHGGRLLDGGVRIEHAFLAGRESRRRRNLLYLEILQEEMVADPSDLSRVDFLAAEYHQLGMYPEAAALLERLTTLRPNDPQTHLFAGAYHLLFKPDWVQARLDLGRALALKPDYPEAHSFVRLLENREKVTTQDPKWI